MMPPEELIESEKFIDDSPFISNPIREVQGESKKLTNV
jgi:hypothetical protein